MMTGEELRAWSAQLCADAAKLQIDAARAIARCAGGRSRQHDTMSARRGARDLERSIAEVAETTDALVEHCPETRRSAGELLLRIRRLRGL